MLTNTQREHSQDVLINAIQDLSSPAARARNPDSLWADHLMSFLDQTSQDAVLIGCDPTEGPHIKAARMRLALRQSVSDHSSPPPPPSRM